MEANISPNTFLFFSLPHIASAVALISSSLPLIFPIYHLQLVSLTYYCFLLLTIAFSHSLLLPLTHYCFFLPTIASSNLLLLPLTYCCFLLLAINNSMEDANFDRSVANQAVTYLHNEEEWARLILAEELQGNLREGEYNFMDRVFDNEM